ncbi:uncharacterized protein LOC117902133 [Drosophila subobscura]|uniref:uncharacterized protein LOC117902133 n=1 Tax=Drosophila subobscura TaxID=7241 RepID=UPI00155A313F|nr:uncharacterized protein LOC117902133 [Drosophila subobscura]
MLLKYFPLILLAQVVLSAPTLRVPSSRSDDPVQKQLEQEAREETVRLLNALFRAQIAYFTEVKAKLNPQSRRATDIDHYVARVNAAIAENDLDKKDQIWLDIFEEFRKSPLLINRPAETGLSDEEYKDLLTDGKLQEISKSFVSEVASYFWKMAKLSGRVVENHIEGLSNDIIRS